ncbi:Hypothetical protein, putative [Bodo saltans]|uniref:Uncharacterized protein n=1 Tax=Bodo saltans TaxID=75058 RepID=A0A0S4JP09_BODSA|nr:Hypothetical protein, putative [Bodo saltans]|eukprot:CUG91667.1 Hypothetical protein, putative [Bodo saltans]
MQERMPARPGKKRGRSPILSSSELSHPHNAVPIRLLTKRRNGTESLPQQSSTTVDRPHWSEHVPIGSVSKLARPCARTKLRVSERLPVVVRSASHATDVGVSSNVFEFLDETDLLTTKEGVMISPPPPSTTAKKGAAAVAADGIWYTDPTPAFVTSSENLRSQRAPLSSIPYDPDDEDYNWCLAHGDAAAASSSSEDSDGNSKMATRTRRAPAAARGRRRDTAAPEKPHERYQTRHSTQLSCGAAKVRAAPQSDERNEPPPELEDSVLSSLATLFGDRATMFPFQTDWNTSTPIQAAYLLKAMTLVFSTLERTYASELLQLVTSQLSRPTNDFDAPASKSSGGDDATFIQRQQQPSCPRCGVCGGVVFPALEKHGDVYCDCGRGLQIHAYCKSILSEFITPHDDDDVCSNDNIFVKGGDEMRLGVLMCSPCWLEAHMLEEGRPPEPPLGSKARCCSTTDVNCRICGQFLLPNMRPRDPVDEAGAVSQDFCVAPFVPALISFPGSGGQNNNDAPQAVHAVCAAANVSSQQYMEEDDALPFSPIDDSLNTCSSSSSLFPCSICNNDEAKWRRLGTSPAAGTPPSTCSPNNQQSPDTTLRRCSAPNCRRNVHVLCAAQENLLGASWFSPSDYDLPPPVAGTEVPLACYVLRPFCSLHRDFVGVQAPHSILSAFPSRQYTVADDRHPSRGGSVQKRLTLHQKAASLALSSLKLAMDPLERSDNHDDDDGGSLVRDLLPESLFVAPANKESNATSWEHRRPPHEMSRALSAVTQLMCVLCTRWVAKRQQTVDSARKLLAEIQEAQTHEAQEPNPRLRYLAQTARKKKLLLEEKETVQHLLRKVSRDEYVLSQHVSLIPELHDFLSDILDGTPFHCERLDFAPGEELRRMRWNREGNSNQQLTVVLKTQLFMSLQKISALTRLVQSRSEKEHELVELRVKALMNGLL